MRLMYKERVCDDDQTPGNKIPTMHAKVSANNHLFSNRLPFPLTYQHYCTCHLNTAPQLQHQSLTGRSPQYHPHRTGESS
jgi:hypothetical protein